MHGNDGDLSTYMSLKIGTVITRYLHYWTFLGTAITRQKASRCYAGICSIVADQSESWKAYQPLPWLYIIWLHPDYLNQQWLLAGWEENAQIPKRDCETANALVRIVLEAWGTDC